MSHLLRSRAPITDATWQVLDDEARARVTPALAARRLVDFSGPHGWEYSATTLGRTTRLESGPAEGVSALQRRVLPVVELRADFALSREELQDADRGADDLDLSALDDAAHQLAVAENVAVIHGWEGAVVGISEASPYEQTPLGTAPDAYPRHVATAIDQLLGSGIAGPYAMALGREQYRVVVQTAEKGGYPLLQHLGKILEGPIVWSPGVSGAVVVSLRGGDFVLNAGEDVSIGYDSHDSEVVRLYLEESFSFHVATPEAAFVFTP
jgi:uncharacterized linocin/CFP29 family protein